MTKKDVNLHPSKKKNYCKYCDKHIIGGSYKFKSHLYVHDAVKARYQCSYCFKGYFRHDMYWRHMNKHERLAKPSTFTKNFICDHCEQSYIYKESLIKHIQKYHNGITLNLPRYTCGACGADYCERRILQNHIRRVHFSTSPTDEPLHVKRKVNETWFETVVESNVCVKMTKVNNNIITIKKCGRVKKEKGLDAGCKGKATDKKFHFTNNYTAYSKAICDYCKKEMLKKSIRKHIRELHLNIRNFECKDCMRTFKRRYQMMEHSCVKVRSRDLKDSTGNTQSLAVLKRP